MDRKRGQLVIMTIALLPCPVQAAVFAVRSAARSGRKKRTTLPVVASGQLVDQRFRFFPSRPIGYIAAGQCYVLLGSRLVVLTGHRKNVRPIRWMNAAIIPGEQKFCLNALTNGADSQSCWRIQIWGGTQETRYGSEVKSITMKGTDRILLVTLAAMLGVAVCVRAATDTDTQTVTITFEEIAAIAASGNPGTLTITAPSTPGSLPDDETDATTTMAWTSSVASGQTRTITGSIGGLFNGINLFCTVAAPGSTSGTSSGETQFVAASTNYNFVTGIGNCNATAQTITYRAAVSSLVAPYTNTQQTVTWTLQEDS